MHPSSLVCELKSIEKGAMEIIGEANRNFQEKTEFDMMLTKNQLQHIREFKDNAKPHLIRKRREALTEAFRKWPNGRLPYVLHHTVDARGRQVISEAISVYHANTCIRIVPKTSTDTDYIEFKQEGGCYSNIGRNGGPQTILIGARCQVKAVVLHEIMHALGFFHEQSRLDRDSHVQLVVSNIQPRFLNQFDKHPAGIADNLGFPYDYTSIMHYTNNQFAIDPHHPTLISKRNPGERLGGALTLTPIDIAQLNKLYNCHRETTKKPITKTSTTANRPKPTPAKTTMPFTQEKQKTTKEITTATLTKTTTATATATRTTNCQPLSACHGDVSSLSSSLMPHVTYTTIMILLTKLAAQ